MEYQALSLTPWTHGAFWVFIAVAIFALLAGRKIAAPIAAMLDARAQSVRDALEEAARLKEEAQALLADAKARQAQATEDAKQILASAHAEAARIAVELAQEAQATAARRERLAMERIAAAEAAAVKDVRAAAIDIATAASAQILREGFGAPAEATRIDQAIANIPAALRRAG
jgi:F-type H+-transporting ATPase subunit b